MKVKRYWFDKWILLGVVLASIALALFARPRKAPAPPGNYMLSCYINVCFS